MSDVNANIGVHIDTSSALTELKNLQRQLATFHSSIAKTSAAATAAQKGLQTNLLNSINSTGKFTATMGNVRTSTESFTHALESNKLSMREYFRYAGGASKSFGKLFKQEFDTIGKVAEDRVKKMQTQYIKMGRDANGAIKAMAITPTTLNMNDYATKTALAAQKQALFNQVVKQGSTQLLNFGKNTQWAGRQLMVGFTIPLAYFGTTASKVFMDLEAQAIKFKRVYGDMFTTSEQTNKALEDVRKLAEEFTKYGVAVSKTMEMAASAAAMGKTGSELTAQVSEATRLAVLGGVEQQQALETTISLTNAFGIAAEDLAGKINFLNSVENQTVVSIEDLTIAVPKAGPVIQQLGGDVEDLAFFMTAMKEGGINASEGANALKSGLASLINPSKKASAFLADFGINIKGIVESNQGDIKGTVIAFSQALDTLDPLNRARAIEQLFGKFQFSRLSTLFQNVTKDGTQASKVLQLAGASVEELAILSERELKTVEDAVGTQFKSAVEELKLAIAPIGKTFLEAVTPIVKVIGGLLEKFNGLSDGTKKFIVVATTIVGGIGPILLMTFGLLANGVANIIKLFLALRTGFLRLGGNSKILAEQTNYLNAEQLESATVAASLNQAHTRLTQSFTAETTAVKLLRQAYVDATIAAANFARANPGMMMPGKGRGKAPKKFARGATYVPGTGNKDTVPSVLTPGEAVIPKDVAQDPQFQPIIDAMVNGTLQGFNGGATGVKKKSTRMSGATQKAHVGKGRERTISEILQSDNISPVNRKKLEVYQSVLKANGLSTSIPVYHNLMYDFDKESNRAMAGAGIPREKFLAEWKRLPQKWSASGISQFDGRIIDDLIHDIIEKEKPKMVNDDYIEKVFAKTIPEQYPEVANSKTYKIMAALHQNLGAFRIGKGLRDTVDETKAVLQKAKDAGAIKDFRVLPTKDSDVDKQGRLITGSIQVIDNDGQLVNLGRGGSGNRVTTLGKVVKEKIRAIREERNKKNAKGLVDREEAMKKVALETSKSPLKDQAPEKYVRQIEKTTGFSFTAAPSIGGVYEKADGTRVFVKPAMDYKSAIAEQRAIQIARSQGLDTPSQTIKTMIDPTDVKGKRKIIVLESPFEDRFNPAKMANTFSKDEYFKQFVAASLRGDNDLKRGNLSGNILADVGAAGVFDKASGDRDYSKNMLSMKEQARVNLTSGPAFFREATANIPKSMTPDEYHSRVIQEIDRTIPKIQQTIASFGLDPEDRKIYQAMIDRLKAGRNGDWREFHKLHSSVLVAKDESLQDKKTGKLTKVKGKPKPKEVKPSSGKLKDNILTQVPEGKRVVKTPIKKIGKYTLPGFADAPDARPTVNGKFLGGSSTDILFQQSALEREAKAAAKKAAAASKINVTDKMLNDAKPGSIGRLSQPGIAMSDAEKQFQSEQRSLRKQIEKTQRESLKAEKDAIKATTDATKATNKGTTATGDTTEKTKLLGTKLTTAVNVFTGVTVAASFLPGKFGELAQSITPFVILLSTIAMLAPSLKSGFTKLLPMLTNPVGMFLAVLAGMVISVKLMQRHADKQAKAQSDYIDAISSSTKKMKAVGIVTDKVGAAEEMALRREGGTANKYTTQFDRAGQQFGTTFLESEVGKSTLKTFKTNLQDGGTDAVKNIALELSTYVSDGLMSAEDANSVARSIGINMSDMTISSNIQGELRSLIGPNGEDLLKDPLNVRIKIGKEQTNIGSGLLSSLEDAGDIELKVELSASISAAYTQSLEIVQAQRDAQAKMYDDQIRALQTQLASTTDKEKQLQIETQIAKLTNQKNQDDVKFGVQKQNIIEDQLKAFRYTESKGGFLQLNRITDAFMKAGKQQVRTQFEGDPFVEEFLTKSAETGDGVTTELEVVLNTIVGAGDLTPQAGTKLLNMFGKTGEAKLQTLLTTTLATKDPGKVAELVNIVTSIGGENGGKIGMQIMTEISAPGQEDKFDDRLSALAMLQKLDNKEINLGLFLEGNAIGKLDELIPMLNKIEAIKGPITLKVLQDFQTTNPDIELTALISDWEKYSKLPDELKKTAIQTYVSIYKSITPETQKEMAKEAVVSNKLGYLPGVSEALLKKFETNKGALAAALNDPIYADGVDGPKKGKGTGNGDGDKKGSRDTTLDDLLKKLKLTRDASINAEGGLKELRNVFNKVNGDITKFAGLNELLREKGADEGFIDFLGGMDNATEKGYLNVDKLRNGIIKLSGDGIKAMALYKEAQLGAFGDTTANSIYQLQKQRTGFVALKSAGASSADALEMISDSNFAVSLSAAKTSEEVQGLINKFKALRRETEITLAQTDPQQYFNDLMDTANRRYDLDEALARRKYEPQIEALELTIDATNRLIDAEQNRIKLDYDQPIEKKQKEISVLQNELSMGVEKQLDANSKISAALSEDQAVIGNIVDQINNKYDLQEKALEKISSINQEIIEQQKDQIGLADALTKGDISAAALAAEEMKQKSAAAVASKAQEMLDQRREADIAAVVGPSGLTAAQISKKQYDIDRSNYSLQVQREAVETKISKIEESIYDLQVLRGDALEGVARDEQKIYDLNVKQIQPLRDKLKAELDTIDAQRDKWRDANLAISKANLDAKDFKDQVIKAEGLVASLAKLWGDISSKEVTLTIEKIEKLIKDQGAGGGGADGGAGAGAGAGAVVDSAATSYAKAKAAGDMAAAAKFAAQVTPSAAAAGESGAIGANSIAGQLRAAEAALLDAAEKARIAAMSKPKEQSTQEALDIAAQARVAAAIGKATVASSTPLTSAQIVAARKSALGYLAKGGMVPKYFAAGGFSRGTDTIPAMLTPGEFVINKNAASEIGINNLNKLNSGESFGSSVYNYSVGINVTNADANANDIARAVMGQIKYIDSQRIRGQK